MHLIKKLCLIGCFISFSFSSVSSVLNSSILPSVLKSSTPDQLKKSIITEDLDEIAPVSVCDNIKFIKECSDNYHNSFCKKVIDSHDSFFDVVISTIEAIDTIIIIYAKEIDNCVKINETQELEITKMCFIQYADEYHSNYCSETLN